MSIFHRVTSRRNAILAAHPELNLDSRFSDLRRRLGRITSGSGNCMILNKNTDINAARALLGEIDKLNADWASVEGEGFGLFVSSAVRKALAEEEVPSQIIRISDQRIEAETFNGLAFPDIDTFRTVMEADGQGHKVDEILADPDVLETLTATGETWEGERFAGEVLSGPVFRAENGDLWVVPFFDDFQQTGFSCDITCVRSADNFRDFA